MPLRGREWSAKGGKLTHAAKLAINVPAQSQSETTRKLDHTLRLVFITVELLHAPLVAIRGLLECLGDSMEAFHSNDDHLVQ
jgi:hypothetical protein